MIKHTIQIDDPLDDTLRILSFLQNAFTILGKVQADSTFISSLGTQLASAYALTQPEKDERDAAALLVEQAQSKVNDAIAELAAVQLQISAAKTQSDADIKSAKDASDTYVATQKAAIDDLMKQSEDYKSQLDIREAAIAKREADATSVEAANAEFKQQLDDRKSALDAFAETLNERLTSVTNLEQAALTK